MTGSGSLPREKKEWSIGEAQQRGYWQSVSKAASRRENSRDNIRFPASCIRLICSQRSPEVWGWAVWLLPPAVGMLKVQLSGRSKISVCLWGAGQLWRALSHPAIASNFSKSLIRQRTDRKQHIEHVESFPQQRVIFSVTDEEGTYSCSARPRSYYFWR